MERTLMLFFCLVVVNAVTNLNGASDHLSQDLDLSRSKRRAQDVSASAIKYMENLRNILTDEFGSPTLSDDDDPTEVWAMQDQDILNDVHRAKSKSKERCTAKNRFLFNWKSLSESQQQKTLPVEKATLRAYLKVIPRLMGPDNPTTVNIDVYMKRVGSDSSMGVHAGELQLSVTPQTGAWVELDITQGVRSLWPPQVDESHVEITVMSRTNCRKRASVYFEDPTSIPLSQVRRRKRLYALQPLFLVYISDENLKEIVRNETSSAAEEFDNFDDTATGSAATQGRQKRQALQKCGMSDFEIVFGDLKLDYVLVPHSYNAKQCTGSCSHQTVTDHKELATNHAKLMASAKVLSQIQPGTFARQPKGPCCVPTKYGSMTLVTPGLDRSLKYVVYPHMVVQECRCR